MKYYKQAQMRQANDGTVTWDPVPVSRAEALESPYRCFALKGKDDLQVGDRVNVYDLKTGTLEKRGYIAEMRDGLPARIQLDNNETIELWGIIIEFLSVAKRLFEAVKALFSKEVRQKRRALKAT